jgi:heme O synthase-like polyprenyltransferase
MNLTHASTPHLYELVVYFGKIIGLLYDFVAVVLFVILIVNGFRYLFSGVNPELKQKANKGFMYAVIGLVVIVLAYIIIAFIGSFVSKSFTTGFVSGSALQFNLQNVASK